MAQCKRISDGEIFQYAVWKGNNIEQVSKIFAGVTDYSVVILTALDTAQRQRLELRIYKKGEFYMTEFVDKNGYIVATDKVPTVQSLSGFEKYFVKNIDNIHFNKKEDKSLKGWGDSLLKSTPSAKKNCGGNCAKCKPAFDTDDTKITVDVLPIDTDFDEKALESFLAPSATFEVTWVYKNGSRVLEGVRIESESYWGTAYATLGDRFIKLPDGSIVVWKSEAAKNPYGLNRWRGLD